MHPALAKILLGLVCLAFAAACIALVVPAIQILGTLSFFQALLLLGPYGMLGQMGDFLLSGILFAAIGFGLTGWGIGEGGSELIKAFIDIHPLGKLAIGLGLLTVAAGFIATAILIPQISLAAFIAIMFANPAASVSTFTMGIIGGVIALPGIAGFMAGLIEGGIHLGNELFDRIDRAINRAIAAFNQNEQAANSSSTPTNDASVNTSLSSSSPASETTLAPVYQPSKPAVDPPTTTPAPAATTKAPDQRKQPANNTFGVKFSRAWMAFWSDSSTAAPMSSPVPVSATAPSSVK